MARLLPPPNPLLPVALAAQNYVIDNGTPFEQIRSIRVISTRRSNDPTRPSFLVVVKYLDKRTATTHTVTAEITGLHSARIDDED